MGHRAEQGHVKVEARAGFCCAATLTTVFKAGIEPSRATSSIAVGRGSGSRCIFYQYGVSAWLQLCAVVSRLAPRASTASWLIALLSRTVVSTPHDPYRLPRPFPVFWLFDAGGGRGAHDLTITRVSLKAASVPGGFFMPSGKWHPPEPCLEHTYRRPAHSRHPAHCRTRSGDGRLSCTFSSLEDC